MFEGHRSLERRRRKGHALEKRSVGCQTRFSYLSLELLERDGVALAIDRLTNSSLAFSVAFPHIQAFTCYAIRALVPVSINPSRDAVGLYPIPRRQDPFHYPLTKGCLLFSKARKEESSRKEIHGVWLTYCL